MATLSACEARPQSCSVPSCTAALHESIKADDARWLAETVPIGIQRDLHGRPILALRNCLACRGTLARRIVH